jgi:tRNA(fMet)-specific endonuclease VapC
MKFLLDTNICIYIINRKPRNVIDHFRKYSPGDIGISSITAAELNYGVQKSSKPDSNLVALKEFLQPLVTLDFDSLDGDTYGKVRNDLEKRGQPIGAMDLLIASQAIARSLILVTNNEKEFKRIKGLHIENWASIKANN